MNRLTKESLEAGGGGITTKPEAPGSWKVTWVVGSFWDPSLGCQPQRLAAWNPLFLLTTTSVSLSHSLWLMVSLSLSLLPQTLGVWIPTLPLNSWATWAWNSSSGKWDQHHQHHNESRSVEASAWQRAPILLPPLPPLLPHPLPPLVRLSPLLLLLQPGPTC